MTYNKEGIFIRNSQLTDLYDNDSMCFPGGLEELSPQITSKTHF
jgi:hypothetical protein